VSKESGSARLGNVTTGMSGRVTGKLARGKQTIKLPGSSALRKPHPKIMRDWRLCTRETGALTAAGGVQQKNVAWNGRCSEPPVQEGDRVAGN